LIVYVADSPEDMRVGKELGAVCVGVLTNHSKNDLRNVGADYTVELGEVIDVLRKIRL